jgi:hypothetical protein
VPFPKILFTKFLESERRTRNFMISCHACDIILPYGIYLWQKTA